MNDALFTKSFYFCEVHRGKHAYTDMRSGSPLHYIAYMLRGRARIAGTGTQITSEAGELFYIPRGLPYRSYWQDEEDVAFLSLGFPYLPSAEKKSYPLQVLSQSSQTLALLSKVPLGGRTDADGIAALYALIAHLLPQMQEGDICRSHRVMHLTENLLWENPKLSTAEIARELGICESALYAAFQKEGEETPHGMKTRILFEKAKDLLVTTELSIEEISERLGFCSCTYFRKRFKAHFGHSPREMRKTFGAL